MAPNLEKSLLAALETPGTMDIYDLFSQHLSPLIGLSPTNPDRNQIVSLTKKFLSFLNESLSILYKRLYQKPLQQEEADQLFNVYELCLCCVDKMELDCPYGAQEMRLGLIDCLESHAKFEKAEREGFKILEGLRAKNFEEEFGNKGFAEVFVKTVVIMVECESDLLRKDEAVYKRHLDLRKEATRWFSVLDANEHQKYHDPLVAYMCKCLHFLAGELDYFDEDLVCEFAIATLTEYANSSNKGQLCKFSSEICCSLFSQQNNKPVSVGKIIFCILGFVAHQYKVDKDDCRMDFYELAIHCVLLHDVGVLLYNKKQLEMALEALTLCCRTSWTCVVRQCNMFVQGYECSEGDLSNIADFVNQSFKRTGYLLNVLHRCGNQNVVRQTTLESLEHWSVARNRYAALPSPTLLVKQWVKIEFELQKNADRENDAQTLYSLLSNSDKMSKRTIGIILEQELYAYEEMYKLGSNSDFSHRMQMKVFDILLQCVYNTQDNDNRFQKSRILLRKGRAIRARGTAALRECIQYLSNAIDTMKDIYREADGSNTALKHQLAVAYCLRALCTQEDEPKSKLVTQDIYEALQLWLSISIPFRGSKYVRCNMLSSYTIVLLYNIVDLLSMKGFLVFHRDIYELLIRLLKWKYDTTEKCLSILWEARRLSHALCVAPVSEEFIMNLAGYCDEQPTSLNFWIRCLKDVRPQLVGFQQTLFFLFADLPCGCCISRSSRQSFITIGDVDEQADLVLGSSDSQPPGSVFLVGYLCYDLCERLISNGLLLKALSYAKKALKLRTQLLMENFSYSVEHGYQVAQLVANEVWSFDADTREAGSQYLSPWNVLKCYLESVLQVGIIYELVGNGVEAERFLCAGKDISCSKNLPLFVVTFSSVLGKLYHKKQNWDLAGKELATAKQILEDTSTDFSCSKCSLMLGATVNKQLGDLSRSRFDTANISAAEEYYKLALEKLECSEWKNLISCPGEANSESTRDDPNAEMEQKKRRRTETAQEHDMIPGLDSRITRSKSRSEASFICNKMNCWQSVLVEVIESERSLENLVNIKWEFARRRLSLRILNGIGKCMDLHDHQTHEAHDIILQRVDVLINRNTFSHTYSPVPSNSMLDLIGKQFSGDIFAVERAVLLYDICWLSLRRYHSKRQSPRKSCCYLFPIRLQEIVSLLKIAFVLCREVPILVQKVSRLLSLMYSIYGSSKHFSWPSSCKELSASHWASFFHQASIGAHFNYQFLSNGSGTFEAQHLQNSKDRHVSGSSDIASETCNLLRIAPKSFQDLENFVKNFFAGLPCTTIICISLHGGADSDLLKDLLHYPSCVHAWVLLSRFNSDSQPIVLLLPVNTLLKGVSDDEDANSLFKELYESNDCEKNWRCPWGSTVTVVDNVAPTFKSILELNYLNDKVKCAGNVDLWEKRKMMLDQCLGGFLSKLEDSWLGPWKSMLLGEQSNCKRLNSVHEELLRDLKSECKVDVDKNLLRVMVGGLKSGCKVEGYVRLCFNKGCYYDESGCKTPSKGRNRVEAAAYRLMHEAMKKLGEDSVDREPTILVLDCEVQMLPWENMPGLRKQEVYRMPSVGSIYATLERIHHEQEQLGRLGHIFPQIDPLDAYYLLNPAGDLKECQVMFENLFRKKNLKGKAGFAPTAEELAIALKSHDLFIYFGHGSGHQYISGRDLLKLEKCAAAFLMGCSSGSLSLNGRYRPEGTPLSYLLAGSPLIVGNLWDVSSKDIVRFGKAMLDACFGERESLSVGCDQCTLLVEEVDAQNMRGCKGNKKNISRGQKAETSETGYNGCDHRPKLGSFRGQASEACELEFLTGAAPVFYGVPTGLRKGSGGRPGFGHGGGGYGAGPSGSGFP